MAGAVLAKLYESHPVPIALVAEQFLPNGEADLFRPGMEDYGLLSHDAEFVMATVDFLVLEEFVRIKGRDQAYFSGATLSAKGLVALNAFPTSLDGKKSIGDQMTDAAKKGAKSVLGTLAKEAISSAVGIAVAAVTR